MPGETVQEHEGRAALPTQVEEVKPQAVDDEVPVQRAQEVHGGRIAGFCHAGRSRPPPGLLSSGRRHPAMLVNCSAYEDGRKLGDVPPDKISEYLRRPGCFVWVALSD